MPPVSTRRRHRDSDVVVLVFNITYLLVDKFRLSDKTSASKLILTDISIHCLFRYRTISRFDMSLNYVNAIRVSNKYWIRLATYICIQTRLAVHIDKPWPFIVLIFIYVLIKGWLNCSVTEKQQIYWKEEWTCSFPGLITT